MSNTIDIPIWYKGESNELALQITESDLVTPIPISDYANIIVWIYDAKFKQVLEKYSWKVLTDHNTDDFVIISDPDGQFKIRIQDTVTRLAKCDNYIFEIKTAKTDADYDSGHYDMIAMEYFCQFQESKTKDLNIVP